MPYEMPWTEPRLAPSAPEIRVGHIRTTFWCWARCAFCDFSRPHATRNLNDAPPAIHWDALASSPLDISSASWIKLGGGLSLREPFDYWLEFIRHLRPMTQARIQVFSVVELMLFQRETRRSFHDLMALLKWAGADALGSGGTESLTHHVVPFRPLAPTPEDYGHILDAGRGVDMEIGVSSMSGPGWPEGFILHSPDFFEVKPFRPMNTHIPSRETPHLMDLVRSIQILRQNHPKTPIFVSRPGPGDDRREILSGAGANGYLIHDWELTP